MATPQGTLEAQSPSRVARTLRRSQRGPDVTAWPSGQFSSGGGAMPERYLGQLKPDMEVCDLTGEKVGTLSHIYGHAEAAVSADGGVTPPGAEPATPTYDEVIEVKTGFL